MKSNLQRDDIDFSHDGKEMHIWIDSNYNGNIYVSIDVELIKEKLKELEGGSTKNKK